MTIKPDTESNGSRPDLSLLEFRMRRLEFLLTGNSDLDGIPNAVGKSSKSSDAVASRLSSIQADLERLRHASGPAGDLIREIESLHARVPEIAITTSAPSIGNTFERASVVLAHATLYPETASRLSSLQTLHTPPAEQSAKLSDLSPNIQACRRAQQALDSEIEDLRQRSARCLEWWVKVGVVGMGDLWEDWEDRILVIERQLARFERLQKDREGYI